MMRLKRREEVEFEGDARMPRRHDAVGDELPLARRSEMAVDAHPRAHHRVFQLAKARAQIGEMLLAHLGIGVGGGADPGIMAGDPAAGGAVTRFARHPILDRACPRSEEHTSELQSLMRISYAVFYLK